MTDGRRRGLAVLAPLLSIALLGGCTSATTSSIAAAGGGIAVGSLTANPAVAIGVGLAIRAAADEAISLYGRITQNSEQTAIANTAGALPEGGSASWAIRHTLPIDNEHGHLTVVRDITSRLVECKEIIFTVEDGADRNVYTTQICRQGDHWMWAAAEPAVERWGYLQ